MSNPATKTNEQLAQESIPIAQNILSQRFNGSLQLEAGAVLRGSNRSYVARCHVSGGMGSAPETVVVKRALSSESEQYDPDSSSGPTMGLFNEWASLQFLGECFGEESPVPRFYGGDREAGVVVMQDVGAAPGLDVLLRGDNATAASDALGGLMRVIGRLHAVSSGKGQRFQELRQALGATKPGNLDYFATFANSFKTTLERVGVSPQAGLESELEACTRLVLESGPFSALIHGDPCPDNCLVTPQGVRLLDFEMARFGLALWDGAYARIHFPTCWCVNRIPQPLVEEVEAIYRVELVRGCPEAADDALFGAANVAACASALFMSIHWAMPRFLEHDGEWGLATHRQRLIVRSGLLAQAANRWNCFPILAETALQLEEKLRGLWSSETEEMPLYPAFRPA